LTYGAAVGTLGSLFFVRIVSQKIEDMSNNYFIRDLILWGGGRDVPLSPKVFKKFSKEIMQKMFPLRKVIALPYHLCV
jgi:hypothetical protein